MRARDCSRLEADEYDLLVVGGGIHGLTIAYEAVSRGLRVALIEAADFGGGASFNHQKTAHGGLRALSTGDVLRARGMILERRALARIAPLYLRPLPFVVATHASLTRSRLALRVAFAAERWLGRDRNAGVPAHLHLPCSRLVPRAHVFDAFHRLPPEGLTGGAQWYDYQMVESDRLTLAFAAAADLAGATLANYVEAASALRDNGAVRGMVARDRVTERTLTVRARLTVNAAGAGGGAVMRMFGSRRDLPLLRAMNLVTSKPARDPALAAPAPDGRMLTLVPWRGRAIIGTAQATRLAAPDDLGVREADVEAFIRDANDAFPFLRLTRSDVTLVHRGLLPAIVSGASPPRLLNAPRLVDHRRDGAPGAMTVIGVKYVTARGVAERTVDAAFRILGRRGVPSRTDRTPLPGAGIADHQRHATKEAGRLGVGVPDATIAHLACRYGSAAVDLVRLMAERPELPASMGGDIPTCAAEIVHAIRHEMAVRLTDIVIRRTGLGEAGCPPREVLAACAGIAASELEWTAERQAAEVAAVEDHYAPVGASRADAHAERRDGS